MKKLSAMVLIFLSLQCPQRAMAFNDVKFYQKLNPEESIAPLSKEEVFQAYIGVITAKYTKKPLRDYYGMDLSYQLEFVKVIDAKMIYGTNKVEFIFKTQVQPFVGAHNPVGTDEFTFRINNSKVTLEKYEHVESFPIPPHLKQYYKNLKPNY